jgi:hypothetical protein
MHKETIGPRKQALFLTREFGIQERSNFDEERPENLLQNLHVTCYVQQFLSLTFPQNHSSSISVKS